MSGRHMAVQNLGPSGVIRSALSLRHRDLFIFCSYDRTLDGYPLTVTRANGQLPHHRALQTETPTNLLMMQQIRRDRFRWASTSSTCR